MAMPSQQEMDLRSQLEVLKNQLIDVEAKLNTAQGEALSAVQSERIEIQNAIQLVSAELFVVLEARQRQTVQIADQARGFPDQPSSSSGSQLPGRVGPISYSPPIIEEVADLSETF